MSLVGGEGIGVAEGIWIERIGKGRLLGGKRLLHRII